MSSLLIHFSQCRWLSVRGAYRETSSYFALPQSVNQNNISNFGPLLLKVSRILVLLCATKDGSLLVLEATYFPIKNDGKVIGVMKIASDVTEQYLHAVSQRDL